MSKNSKTLIKDLFRERKKILCFQGIAECRILLCEDALIKEKEMIEKRN